MSAGAENHKAILEAQYSKVTGFENFTKHRFDKKKKRAGLEKEAGAAELAALA